MIDEYQLVLEPALRSLREVRSAYRRDAQRDLEVCNSLLRAAVAHIERCEVQLRVDRTSLNTSATGQLTTPAVTVLRASQRLPDITTVIDRGLINLSASG